MRKRFTFTHGGQYIAETPDGPQRVEAHGQAPAFVMCRRVSDYPLGLPPIGARVLTCSQCDAPIAANPAGPHQDRPHVCMQCGGFEPLPFPPARD